MSMHGAPSVGYWTGRVTFLSPAVTVTWSKPALLESDTKHSSSLHAAGRAAARSGNRVADNAILELSHNVPEPRLGLWSVGPARCTGLFQRHDHWHAPPVRGLRTAPAASGFTCTN